jgi:hypothetical protein
MSAMGRSQTLRHTVFHINCRTAVSQLQHLLATTPLDGHIQRLAETIPEV